LLAQLQAIRFPQPGLLTPSLDVDSSLLPKPLTTAALVEMFARSQTFTRRSGSRLTADIVAVAREWDEHPTAPALPTTLVHGDFNARNVFVARRVGRWRVTAILDWEFAFAGPAYC